MNHVVSSLSELLSGTAAAGHQPLYHTSGGWKTVQSAAVDVRAFGATGDGSTDDTTAIQAALDSGATGVLFPKPSAYYKISAALTPASGQALIAENGLQYPYSSATETKIQGTHNGTLINILNADGVLLRGLTLQGTNNAAHTNNIGVVGTTSFACAIEHCSFLFFGSSAVKWISGNALRIENSFTSNCVLGYAALADWLGAIDLSVTDHYIHHNEFGAVGGVYSGGWSAALVLRSGGNFISDNVCELSETGLVLTTAATINVLINNRCDHNQGHGFVIGGNNHVLIGNRSGNNGLQADNTYSCFRITSDASNCVLIGNSAQTLGGGNTPKYAFEDLHLNTLGAGNIFSDNIAPSTSYKTGRYHTANAFTVIHDPYEYGSVVSGDGSKFVGSHSDVDTQIWNSPLTADRSLTLSVTNATNGSRFRIVRTAAATGAFNLNVIDSLGVTLKALAAGQWCDVVLTDSTNKWMLAAFGSL